MRLGRPTAEELKSLNVVVLHGTSERKDLLVMGWVEDVPHHESEQAIVLYEPVYFMHQGPSGGASVEVNYVVPHRGIPLSTEFFEFTKVEVYEAISPFGKFYSSAVLHFRNAPQTQFVPKQVVATPVQQQERR